MKPGIAIIDLQNAYRNSESEASMRSACEYI
jgi:hypothetical protein